MLEPVLCKEERERKRAQLDAAATKQIQTAGQARWAAQVDERNQEKKAMEDAAEQLKAKRQKRREKKEKAAAKVARAHGMCTAGDHSGSASATGSTATAKVAAEPNAVLREAAGPRGSAVDDGTDVQRAKAVAPGKATPGQPEASAEYEANGGLDEEIVLDDD